MRACVGLVLVVALGACTEDSEQSPKRLVLESVTDEVFLPMLAEVVSQAESLSAGARDFCSAPGRDRLLAVRDAWQAARAPWKQAEVMAFGPQDRLSAAIDFWPARVDTIDEVLAGDADLTVEGALEQQGAAARGFPAIEVLLYAAGDADATLATFETGPLAQRRCDYLVALTQDLVGNAQAVHALWRDVFADELALRAPGRYEDVRTAFGDLLSTLVYTVETIRDVKLGKPLGLASGGTPQPELVESRFSQRSVEDARDNLRGVEAVFTGRYGSHEARGVAFLLEETHPEMNAVFAMHAERSMQALAAIEPSLGEAVEHDAAFVQNAIDVLRDLVVFLRVDLGQALAVTVTFGGTDGD